MMKAKKKDTRGETPGGVNGLYRDNGKTPMSTIMREYWKVHGMEYKVFIEGRRQTLGEDALAIYREGCRQENVKSGGVFVPLARVDEDDGEMLRAHDRLISVAEALTGAGFEIISQEDFAAAMIQFQLKDKEDA